MTAMKRFFLILALCLPPLLTGCKQQPFLELDRATIDAEAAGGTERIGVNANYPWTATASATWIKVRSDDDSFTLTLSANTSPDGRTGTVTVTCEDIVKTVTVGQAQLDLVMLDSASQITIGPEAQEIQIQLRSNTDPTVSIDPSGADWVHVVSTKALTAQTVTLRIDANSGPSMRRAAVRLSGPAGNDAQEVAIEQNGTDKFLKVTVSGVDFYQVPQFTAPAGRAFSGRVYWNGSATPQDYRPDLSFPLAPALPGVLRIEAQEVETVTFENIEGVVTVDLSGLS